MKEKYKIIMASNFDNPRIDEILFCENISKEDAINVCELLTKQKNDNNSTYYFRPVAMSYILYTFEP